MEIDTNRAPDPRETRTGAFARLGVSLAGWSERWFPDALVFALIAIVMVFVAGLLLGSPARELVRDFGDGFWELIPFTMQMAMIVIGMVKGISSQNPSPKSLTSSRAG